MLISRKSQAALSISLASSLIRNMAAKAFV
jgi:hypothetical protein